MKPIWDMSEIIKGAAGEFTRGSPDTWSPQCDLLLWTTKEDSRPLLVESCLVLLQYTDDGDTDRFSLIHMYRHPREQCAERCGWRGAFSTADYSRHRRTFLSMPTAFRVESFARSCGYFDCFGDHSWRIIETGLDHDRWQELLGEAMSIGIVAAITSGGQQSIPAPPLRDRLRTLFSAR